MLRIIVIIFAILCLNFKDFTKYGKGKEKLLPKIEEISRGKAHTNTCKLIQNILMITDVFFNQKRVNVCDHMVKIASRF